jgi:hypothetical protein
MAVASQVLRSTVDRLIVGRSFHLAAIRRSFYSQRFGSRTVYIFTVVVRLMAWHAAGCFVLAENSPPGAWLPGWRLRARTLPVLRSALDRPSDKALAVQDNNLRRANLWLDSNGSQLTAHLPPGLSCIDRFLCSIDLLSRRSMIGSQWHVPNTRNQCGVRL